MRTTMLPAGKRRVAALFSLPSSPFAFGMLTLIAAVLRLSSTCWRCRMRSSCAREPGRASSAGKT